MTPDPTPPAGGGAPPGTPAPPATPPAANPPAPPATPPGGDERRFSQQEVEDLIRKRLGETKDLEAKAKKWDEYERANMSELEKLKADTATRDAKISALEAELQEYKLNEARVKAVKDAGLDPAILGAGAGLMDLMKASTPEEILKAAKKLAEQGAQIPPKGAAPGGNPGGGVGRVRKFTRAEIKAMTPAEYAKNRAEIHAAMERGELK